MNEKSLKVLEQYEIEVLGTRRGRGSYICETNRGKVLLANCAASEKKMAFVNRLLEAMRERGYPFADIVLANREGKLLSMDRDEEVYIVKDWYEGRECDTKSMADIEQTIRHLAGLHKRMYFMPDDENGDGSYIGEDLKSELERHNRELCKIYSFMRKRKQKGDFEVLFLNCFRMFYEQAQEAVAFLEQSGCAGLRMEMLRRGALCHGNFNQHNVWFVGKDQVFIGNFDRCRYDVQCADLYQFMRKMMEKQDWSKRSGYRMLEWYDRERTLDERERMYLYARLLYPEKFWKLANQYYNHNKAWIPQKNTEKLKTLIRQQDQRNSFLKTLE